MEVKLTLHTPEIAIGENAKICYNTKPISEGGKDITKSLVHGHGHLAALRFAYATFNIKDVSISCQNQLVRSKHLDFMVQCLTGDSDIYVKNGKKPTQVKKVKLGDLYSRFSSGKPLPQIRVFNTDTCMFEFSEIAEVFYNGCSEVYEVTTEDGLVIKATSKHRFYTKSGFVRLENLTVGDFIGRNGKPAYQDYDLLKKAKEESLQVNGVQYIADKFGVSYHTIRIWLRKLNLTFTRSEVLMYTRVWNKGKGGVNYCLSGRSQTLEHRRNSAAARKAQYKSHGHKTDFRHRVSNYWQSKLNIEDAKLDTTKCAECSTELKGDFDIDHIKPVSLFPELAFSNDNVQVLCKSCHKNKTAVERKHIRKTVGYTRIKSIKKVGAEPVYDIAVKGKYHNYVANKFLVHNSKRYTDITKGGNKFIMPTSLTEEQETLMQQCYDNATDVYRKLVASGVKKEDARAVLPMNTSTNLNVTGNLQAFNDFFKLRLTKHAQTEIRQLASIMYDKLAEVYPNVFTEEHKIKLSEG